MGRGQTVIFRRQRTTARAAPDALARLSGPCLEKLLVCCCVFVKKREQLSLLGNQGLVNMLAKIKVLKKESILPFGYGIFLFV